VPWRKAEHDPVAAVIIVDGRIARVVLGQAVSDPDVLREVAVFHKFLDVGTDDLAVNGNFASLKK
jgi:hypothetical protein